MAKRKSSSDKPAEEAAARSRSVVAQRRARRRLIRTPRATSSSSRLGRATVATLSCARTSSGKRERAGSPTQEAARSCARKSVASATARAADSGHRCVSGSFRSATVSFSPTVPRRSPITAIASRRARRTRSSSRAWWRSRGSVRPSAVTVTGTDFFKKEAWFAARLVGLDVRGYKPTALEQERLVRALARRREAEQGEEPSTMNTSTYS